MRYAIEPVGFPKTKQGKWKYPAIFLSEEVAKKFCRDWYEQTFEAVCPTLEFYSKESIENLIEDDECTDKKIAHRENRMTDDLTGVWSTPRGYFLVREF